MATLLLAIIYMAFIGLGVPDSLFGAAMPAIIEDFSLPLSLPNIVTTLTCGCTVISSIFATRITNRLGTAKVTALSTALTAISLVGFSISGNLFIMCLFAIPLGLSAGAIDASLNNFVALRYSARQMNFLHCFYGVGVIISPSLMSLMLKIATWREGYLLAAFIQAIIALFLFASFPLWKKVCAEESAEESVSRVLSIRQMIKVPGAVYAWLLCFATNAIEALPGAWGSAYLIYVHGLSQPEGARGLILYYLGMTLGRFCSGVLSKYLSSWRIIRLGSSLVFISIVLLAIPFGSPLISTFGLFLIGLGNGPVYPNIVHLTPQNFGADISGSMMGSQLAFAFSGFMLSPPLFGLLAQNFGVGALPTVLIVWFAVLILSIVLIIKTLSPQKK